MTLRACPHETEIKQLLEAGQWPLAAPGELRAHAAGCRACSDRVLLTQAFRAARQQAASSAQLPPPGVLWWRAQLRRRQAAMERMAKPIIGAQIFAIAIAVLAAFVILLTQGREGLRWLSETGQSGAFHIASLWNSSASGHGSPQWMAILWNPSYGIPALVLLLLLGGMAVYLSLEKQ